MLSNYVISDILSLLQPLGVSYKMIQKLLSGCLLYTSIKNTIHEAIKTEERKYAEEIGVEQSENENEPEENTNEAEVLRDKKIGRAHV